MKKTHSFFRALLFPALYPLPIIGDEHAEGGGAESDTPLPTLAELLGNITAAAAAAQAEKLKQKPKPTASVQHPLLPVFLAALDKATQGKGTRHGGEAQAFYAQTWARLADTHGVGFLTGQAAKKLEEATGKLTSEAAIHEILGAINYAAMACLAIAEKPERPEEVFGPGGRFYQGNTPGPVPAGRKPGECPCQNG